MRREILNFNKQFAYDPAIENVKAFLPARRYVAVGMGGSHLAADLIKLWKPSLHLDVHKNYRLPPVPEKTLKEHLIILSSYSGNTEEVLAAFRESLARNLNFAAISTNGKLLELAKKYRCPYIELPNTAIPSRLALGLSVLAHLKLIGEDAAIAELHRLTTTLNPREFEEQGKSVAKKIQGKIPIIYASAENKALAYNWKIKFNETGKIPAFYNLFPELNHNELQGFVSGGNFCFILIKDDADEPRIRRRMVLTQKLLVDRGYPVVEISLYGKNFWHKVFSHLLIADWASFYLAQIKGVDPVATPLITEFKQLLDSDTKTVLV